MLKEGDVTKLVMNFSGMVNKEGTSVPVGVFGTIISIGVNVQWFPTLEEWRCPFRGSGVWHMGPEFFEKVEPKIYQDVFTFSDWANFQDDSNFTLLDNDKRLKRSVHFPHIIAILHDGTWFFCFVKDYRRTEGKLKCCQFVSILESNISQEHWEQRFYQFLARVKIV